MYKARHPCAYKKCKYGVSKEGGLCYRHSSTYARYKKNHPDITQEEYFSKIYKPTGPQKNPRPPRIPYFKSLK